MPYIMNLKLKNLSKRMEIIFQVTSPWKGLIPNWLELKLFLNLCYTPYRFHLNFALSPAQDLEARRSVQVMLQLLQKVLVPRRLARPPSRVQPPKKPDLILPLKLNSLKYFHTGLIPRGLWFLVKVAHRRQTEISRMSLIPLQKLPLLRLT